MLGYRSGLLLSVDQLKTYYRATGMEFLTVFCYLFSVAYLATIFKEDFLSMLKITYLFVNSKVVCPISSFNS